MGNVVVTFESLEFEIVPDLKDLEKSMHKLIIDNHYN